MLSNKANTADFFLIYQALIDILNGMHGYIKTYNDFKVLDHDWLLINIFQLLTICLTDKLRSPLSMELLILDTVNFTFIIKDYVKHNFSSFQSRIIKHLSWCKFIDCSYITHNTCFTFNEKYRRAFWKLWWSAFLVHIFFTMQLC